MSISLVISAQSVYLYWEHMLNKNDFATDSEVQLLNVNITIWMRGIVNNKIQRRYNTNYTELSYTTSNQTGIKLVLADSHYTVLTNKGNIQTNERLTKIPTIYNFYSKQESSNLNAANKTSRERF